MILFSYPLIQKNNTWHVISTMCLLNKILNYIKLFVPWSFHLTVYIRELPFSPHNFHPYSSFFRATRYSFMWVAVAYGPSLWVDT
jgi:hypothetical protein